jgi:protein-tyrosine kinase
MDSIRQALERTRAPKGGNAKPGANGAGDRLKGLSGGAFADPLGRCLRECTLDRSHLDANRIIAHDERHPRVKSFDMLRTQVLQTMDQQNWKVLGITSPTPDCGKTVTAVNLAFSIARQPDRSVVLVDLDLQKPRVANALGLKVETGLLAVLQDQTDLPSAVVAARVGNYHAMVLPAEGPIPDSSAWIASRAMSVMLQDIKNDYQSSTIIVDLPPMLVSDDVIALLPQLDCVLLIAAAGKSTIAQIEECNKHLQSTEVVRLVLNKAAERTRSYYY